MTSQPEAEVGGGLQTDTHTAIAFQVAPQSILYILYILFI